jgi:hypothetical protein
MLAFRSPGWSITQDDPFVVLRKLVAPDDIREGHGTFDGLRREFSTSGMSEEHVINRVFATQQFLVDHELRDTFEVNGVRVFNPHEPDVTGLQQDWFIEQQAAVRGY